MVNNNRRAFSWHEYVWRQSTMHATNLYIKEYQPSQMVSFYWSSYVECILCHVYCYLVIFAYYTSLGCDPVQSGQISSGNQILPYYIMDVLAYPGLPGVMFSSLFSGALSTLSSSINSVCCNVGGHSGTILQGLGGIN